MTLPKITFNAPITLTLVLLGLIEITLATVFGAWVTSRFFSTPSSIFQLGLFNCITLLTYTAGHASWAHYLGNASWLIVLGPLLEEKYGSLTLAVMIVITAIGTALCNCLLGYSLVGASGIVFLFIILSSFTSYHNGSWPITFFLVALFYLAHEVVATWSGDNISHLGHLLGGVFGILFGLLLAGKPNANLNRDHVATPPIS